MLNSNRWISSIPSSTQIGQIIWKLWVEINLYPDVERKHYCYDFHENHTCSRIFCKENFLPNFTKTWQKCFVGETRSRTDRRRDRHSLHIRPLFSLSKEHRIVKHLSLSRISVIVEKVYKPRDKLSVIHRNIILMTKTLLSFIVKCFISK